MYIILCHYLIVSKIDYPTIGRHRRHHKHRRSRRASGDKKDDKKVEDTDIDKPQSDAPYDLVAAESYASNPCLLPYTPRCGGPR